MVEAQDHDAAGRAMHLGDEPPAQTLMKAGRMPSMSAAPTALLPPLAVQPAVSVAAEGSERGDARPRANGMHALVDGAAARAPAAGARRTSRW